MSTIKVRRGLNANLPAGGTEEGEPRFSTDTGQLYIDDGTDNVEITPNASNVASALHGAAEKGTIHDDDEIGGIDTEASNVLAWWKWSTIKATLKSYFDTLYTAVNTAVLVTGNQTVAGKKTLNDTLTVTPSGNDAGLIVDTPSGATGATLNLRYGGVTRLTYHTYAHEFDLKAYDAGTSYGPFFRVGNNNNASTPAPGFVACRRANGTGIYLYPDDSGVWRTTVNILPTNAAYASGNVVGAQTSHIDYKEVLGAPISDSEALDLICLAAAKVARFVYKDGAFGGEEFSGIVLDGDELDRYGMDADEEHPTGKSLNVINAIGDLFLAVRELNARLEALEAVSG